MGSENDVTHCAVIRPGDLSHNIYGPFLCEQRKLAALLRDLVGNGPPSRAIVEVVLRPPLVSMPCHCATRVRKRRRCHFSFRSSVFGIFQDIPEWGVRSPLRWGCCCSACPCNTAFRMFYTLPPSSKLAQRYLGLGLRCPVVVGVVLLLSRMRSIMKCSDGMCVEGLTSALPCFRVAPPPTTTMGEQSHRWQRTMQAPAECATLHHTTQYRGSTAANGGRYPIPRRKLQCPA